jgi:arabinose-5-phosphate isomerase
MTGDPASTLGRESDITLDVGVEREACPLGLAPTTSTTVSLAVGDALAMTLLELRGFSQEDYVRFHPGGSLGRRLSLRVCDFMRTGDLIPIVSETDTLDRAVTAMTEKDTLGVTLVHDDAGRLSGILTDGDLRRILRREKNLSGLLDRPVAAYMSRNPRTIEPDVRAGEALRIMEVRGITSLAIVDGAGRPAGIVHLHDILGRSKFLV